MCCFSLWPSRVSCSVPSAHRQPLSLLLTAMLAFNPHLLRFLDNLLSDIPFLFFSVFSVYLIDKFNSRR